MFGVGVGGGETLEQRHWRGRRARGPCENGADNSRSRHSGVGVRRGGGGAAALKGQTRTWSV